MSRALRLQLKGKIASAQVAGQQSGVNVVDKAQSAVNTVKIINALNEISDILKVHFPAHLLHGVLASLHRTAIIASACFTLQLSAGDVIHHK